MVICFSKMCAIQSLMLAMRVSITFVPPSLPACLFVVQCGFFRRAKHEEIKQKREELANLTDNGVSPGGEGGDSTNL